MVENSIVDSINKDLKIYGSNQYGDPLFRVVFSDDQTEKRRGKFRDFHTKIILIREVVEVREVRKYPWIKRRWILERWASGELSHHKDLETNKNGVYVCVYVFQDKNNNYLPPLLKVCQIIINTLLNPRRKDEIINQEIETEIKQDELEVDSIEQELIVQHDESATKDKKAQREKASVGYLKDKI